MIRLLVVLAWAAAGGSALAAEFRTVDTASILYDAPSQKGTKLFVIRRGTPVEVVVRLDGWSKVRDADGGLAWIEARSLANRRSVLVTAARAVVRQNADESAPRASGPPTDRPAESGRPEESRAAFSRAGTEAGRGNEPTPADESGTDTPDSVS